MRFWSALAVTALFVAPWARAHELTCEKTVDGVTYEDVSTYPTTLHYKLTVTNALSNASSDVLSEEDALLEGLGFAFDPAPPFTLLPSGSQSYTDDVTVESYEQCLELAAKSGNEDSPFIDNTYVVGWDDSSATCEARVKCLPPKPPPQGGTTRTIGFWKTHLGAITQCVDDGSIDLGFLTVTTVPQALGILWASPAKYSGGGKRSQLDQDRLITAKQLLGAICNNREFGTPTTPSDLISQTQTALSGTVCADMLTLEGELDAYNQSGDAQPLPNGFPAGKADPKTTRALASDPTTPSGLSCTK